MLFASCARTASVTVLPSAMAPRPAKTAPITGRLLANCPQPGSSAERQVAPVRVTGALLWKLTAAAGARRGAAVEAGLAGGGASLCATAGVGVAAGGGGAG